MARFRLAQQRAVVTRVRVGVAASIRIEWVDITAIEDGIVVIVGVTGIALAVVVGVRLGGVGYSGAVVGGIEDPVTVGVSVVHEGVPDEVGIPQCPPGFGLARAAGDAMLAAARGHPEMVGRAAEAGVLVLAGSDAGMGPHGMIREEIWYLAEAGLPSEAALAAGSWEARRFLGLPGLEEGAPADLVAYPDDPRRDLGVLARPSLRILDGRLLPFPTA